MQDNQSKLAQAVNSLAKYGELSHNRLNTILGNYTTPLTLDRIINILNSEDVPRILILNPYEVVVNLHYNNRLNILKDYTCWDNEVDESYLLNLSKILTLNLDTTPFKTYAHKLKPSNLTRLVLVTIRGYDVGKAYDLSKLSNSRLTNYLELLLHGYPDTQNVRLYYSLYHLDYAKDITYLIDNDITELKSIQTISNPCNLRNFVNMCKKVKINYKELLHETGLECLRNYHDYAHLICIFKHSKKVFDECNTLNKYTNSYAMYLKHVYKGVFNKSKFPTTLSDSENAILECLLSNNTVCHTDELTLRRTVTELVTVYNSLHKSYRDVFFRNIALNNDILIYLNVASTVDDLQQILLHQDSALSKEAKVKFSSLYIADLLKLSKDTLH